MPDTQPLSPKKIGTPQIYKWLKRQKLEKSKTPNNTAHEEDSASLSHDYWVTGEVRVINLRDLAKDELDKIKLTDEDNELLHEANYPLASKLKELEEDHDDPKSNLKKNSRFAEKHPQWLKVEDWLWSHKIKERIKTFKGYFYEFLQIISGVIATVLTGHYLTAFKVLMLVFTAIDGVGALGNKIRSCIKTLGKTADQMNYLRQQVRGKTMQEAVGDFVCAYVLFAIKVRHYQKHWWAVKLAMGFGDIEKTLNGAITQIQECWNRLESIQNTTILATTLQTQSLVRAQARFHSRLYVDEVCDLLSIDRYNFDLQRTFNSLERRNLAPKDRWMYHVRQGVKYPKFDRPLLWVYGKKGKRNTSWVSSFSADVYNSLNNITNIRVADVFCKHQRTVLFTPLDIILRLIVQILLIWPEIILEQTHHMSRQRFRGLIMVQQGSNNPGSQTERAWTLLIHILQLLKGSEMRRSQELMILIDRLDLCRSNTDFTVLGHLIPHLQQLSYDFSYVRVMITTARQPARVVHTLDKDRLIGPKFIRP